MKQRECAVRQAKCIHYVRVWVVHVPEDVEGEAVALGPGGRVLSYNALSQLRKTFLKALLIVLGSVQHRSHDLRWC